MAKKKLYIIDGADSNAYYFNLFKEFSAKEDSALDSVKIRKISIMESILNSSPYLNLKITDGSGNLISTDPIIPDSTFFLKFGKNLETSVETKFKLSVFNADTTTNTMDNISFEGTFITDKWESMYKNTLSRSWKNVKYSDVVRKIAQEAGFEKFDIEETDDVIESVIQPYWNNNQLLKWITKRAINKEGFGGYFYAIRLDGTFMFRTFESLFKEKPVKTLNHHSIQLATNEGFTGLSVKTSYMPTLLGGGFGMKSSHFDYSNKKFVNKDFTLETFPERQLSDWYYLAKSHNEPSRLFYGGRDSDSGDIVQNKILSTANSVNKIEFLMEGNTDLRIGNVITLRIPVSNRLKNESIINETYSGHWLIWKIAHLFDGDGKNYHTQIFAMRNGINGVGVKNLVKTSTGKNIK